MGSGDAFDAAGNGWQSLPDGSLGGYPAQGLRGRGWVGPLRVRCLTAETNSPTCDSTVRPANG